MVKVLSFATLAASAYAGSFSKDYIPTTSTFSQTSFSSQPKAYIPPYTPVQAYAAPMSSFSQQASYTPTVSSLSQASIIQQWQPMKSSLYTPTVSSLSQASVQPVQAYTAPMSSFSQQAAYTPTVSSLSQTSITQPELQWKPMQSSSYQGLQYTPTVSSLSQASVQQSVPSYSTTMGSFSQGAAQSVSDISSPYKVQMLKNMPSQVVVSRTKQAGMPVRHQYIGEQHVIHNDLKVHENEVVDRTILTKKVVHHSPVLHKTVRTHEIAEDTVHDKVVHHLNTVEDQWKKVPGQSYVGKQETLDRTKPLAPAPEYKAPMIPKTVSVAPHNA